MLTLLRTAVRSKLTDLKLDNRAVTAIEYALIASLIAVVIITVVTTVGTNVSTTFSKVANAL